MSARRSSRCWFACAIASVAAAGAAQPPDELDDKEMPPEPVREPVPPGPGEPPPPTPEELLSARPVVFQFTGRGELGLNSGLRDVPGDVTVARLGASFAAAVPVERFAQLDVGMDYEFSHYDFNNATGFVAGFEAPWQRIHRETLSLRFSQQQTLRMGWFVGGTLGFAHEDGADLSDALVGSMFGGVRYAVTERLFVGGGLVVWSQLEDSPLVIPLPGFDWRPTDEIRISTEGRIGLTISYHATEALTFSFGGEYELREFRLKSDGPAPEGVGRDRSVPIAAGLAFTPTPQLAVELAAGAYMWQQFQLLDAGGTTLAEINARPAPFASLQFAYRF